MWIGWTFGILKDKWHIIMKNEDVPLWHMVDIVSTCIVLHNICTTKKDGFDGKYIKSGKKITNMSRQRIIEGKARVERWEGNHSWN